MSNLNATVLLTRLLSLRENSSFHLILDSLTQSSFHLIQEYAHHLSNNHKIIYISFETVNQPQYATDFFDCTNENIDQAISFIKSHTKNGSPAPKSVVMIDSLNYIPNESLTHFIANIVGPNVVIVATYHTNCVEPFTRHVNYPSSLSLLMYIASTILEVEPLLNQSIDNENLQQSVSRLNFTINAQLNSDAFKLILTNRRKSGRSLIYKFSIHSKSHTYEVFNEASSAEVAEEEEEVEEMLRNLTTFNLTTSSKQKLAREQVELPFMQAQETLGSSGGAIVYEFEKDDDYDEEDPYEDPF
ncbi:Elongator subunit Iki1 family protein [Candida parapsilosis]|uniref:Elongator complex protein 5 n=1 Tax=Candida parapsilosis TaxID=5480 RepID=A0A8X7NGV3_CANPA|nr:Elongator subunit Iki1 family protein [Candida parapsilosis]KAF6047696.1 Elongator subunit Iki1 family protein [Candida parapsilosis]KAF6050336.1 Elongator subunit Iki1 family protein [Candida parapsilosis]KAF6061456.1 Elongator subunit Iki1 family protein [Candida parapsilosis]KAI5904711.1 Elongator complex protein 5 [Candida parapsilosis]